MVDEKLLLTLPYELGDKDDLKEAGLVFLEKYREDMSPLGGQLGTMLQKLMRKDIKFKGEANTRIDPRALTEEAVFGAIEHTIGSRKTFHSAEEIRKYLTGSVKRTKFWLLSNLKKQQARLEERQGEQIDIVDTEGNTRDAADTKNLNPYERAGEAAFELADGTLVPVDDYMLEKFLVEGALVLDDGTVITADDCLFDEEAQAKLVDYLTERARRRSRSASLRKRGRQAARDS